VESKNKVNKLFSNTKTSFFDLTKALLSRTEEQAESARLAAIKVR
jgi:hypothetical protein